MFTIKAVRKIVLVVHDVRSAHNVGSILRTADGLGIEQVYLTGYTPYPAAKNDKRLQHIAAKVDKRIRKTSLGAEQTVKWHYRKDIFEILDELKRRGYEIAALEQAANAISLEKYRATKDAALVVGSEIGGLEQSVLSVADVTIEIPMLGAKESFNVSIAAAIALYHLRYLT